MKGSKTQFPLSDIPLRRTPAGIPKNTSSLGEKGACCRCAYILNSRDGGKLMTKRDAVVKEGEG